MENMGTWGKSLCPTASTLFMWLLLVELVIKSVSVPSVFRKRLMRKRFAIATGATVCVH
jgi:hypothetical protein